MRNRYLSFLVWFLYPGFVGLIVASFFAVLRFSRVYGGLGLQIWLWPASLVWESTPASVSDWIVILAVTFGGNFLLYGIIGAYARICFLVWRRTIDEDSDASRARRN